ncbi:MAG: glutathione S-transferase family protein [Rhodanobacteraceae bacterium]|nr:glutathione S-transferase family protein [Rhodanobacteraceae bacterium]
MLTLFDYLPSQNAWKVRLLLNHLGVEYRTEPVSIFEGAGQHADYRRISPTGTVPAIRLDDGRVLAESNAILLYLADGTRYLPADPFGRAKVCQWLSFEQERIESVIGALRHWRLTGKLARRSPELVEAKRGAALRALAILEAELSMRLFLVGDAYTIADMSVFAYASRAEEAGLSLQPYAALRDWIERVRAQPGFLDVTHPYAIDPHSARELPAPPTGTDEAAP